MPEPSLEQDLLGFLQAYVPTVEHLEVLLLISSAPEQTWTVGAVNDKLRSSEDSIASRLQELTAQGLIEKAPAGEVFVRRKDPDLERLLSALRTAYKDRRVRVIQAIYGRRESPVSEFSRAFDFRKRKTDG